MFLKQYQSLLMKIYWIKVYRAISDISSICSRRCYTQGEGHRDALVIRGVRTTADFYQDGIRDDVQYYRSLYNVDQVEVLKGPNALLFGRGGTGGLINRVSKKALIRRDIYRSKYRT